MPYNDFCCCYFLFVVNFVVLVFLAGLLVVVFIKFSCCCCNKFCYSSFDCCGNCCNFVVVVFCYFHISCCCYFGCDICCQHNNNAHSTPSRLVAIATYNSASCQLYPPTLLEMPGISKHYKTLPICENLTRMTNKFMLFAYVRVMLFARLTHWHNSRLPRSAAGINTHSY